MIINMPPKVSGILLICLILTACSQAAGMTETPIAALPTSAPTSTRVWFPQTATPPENLSSLSETSPALATVEIAMPAEGRRLIEEPFQAEAWYLSSPAEGRMSLQEGVLSMAADARRVTFEANSKLILPPQFFLRIDVEISACAADDTYSLYFWKGSELGTFALDFNCKGQMRLRNLRDTGSKLLRDWTAVRKLAPLPPTRNQIGIWALAGRVDVFSNGQFQYEFEAEVSRGGGFGLAYTVTGKERSVLNFSQLGIFEP